jgi:hypothetical protein
VGVYFSMMVMFQGALLYCVCLTKYYLCDQIKTTEMGRACSMFVGGERCIHGVGWGGGSLRPGERLKDQGVGGRIILKWIFEKWEGLVMDRIDLA